MYLGGSLLIRGGNLSRAVGDLDGRGRELCASRAARMGAASSSPTKQNNMYIYIYIYTHLSLSLSRGFELGWGGPCLFFRGWCSCTKRAQLILQRPETLILNPYETFMPKWGFSELPTKVRRCGQFSRSASGRMGHLEEWAQAFGSLSFWRTSCRLGQACGSGIRDPRCEMLRSEFTRSDLTAESRSKNPHD